MTTGWDSAKPAASTSLRLSNPEILTNLVAIEGFTQEDHIGLDVNDGTVGKHKVIQVVDVAANQVVDADTIAIYNHTNALFARLENTGNIITLGKQSDTDSHATTYTAVRNDIGKLLLVTGTTTIDFTTAATLGDGWYIYIKNTGTGTVTLDPASSQTIDGATTKTLLNTNDCVRLTTDSGNFYIVGQHSTVPVIASFAEAAHDHADSAGGGLIDMVTNVPYVRLHDLKATTTAGGTFTSGSWTKRTIIEDQDASGIVTVTSSVIVLDAGDYDCIIVCPARDVSTHACRLRNTSDSTTLLLGSNAEASGANIATHAIMNGRFTIAASKNIEIQHQCTSTGTVGLANSFGESEIYTVAEFWKVSS